MLMLFIMLSCPWLYVSFSKRNINSVIAKLPFSAHNISLDIGYALFDVCCLRNYRLIKDFRTPCFIKYLYPMFGSLLSCLLHHNLYL